MLRKIANKITGQVNDTLFASTPQVADNRHKKIVPEMECSTKINKFCEFVISLCGSKMFCFSFEKSVGIILAILFFLFFFIRKNDQNQNQRNIFKIQPAYRWIRFHRNNNFFVSLIHYRVKKNQCKPRQTLLFLIFNESNEDGKKNKDTLLLGLDTGCEYILNKMC